MHVKKWSIKSHVNLQHPQPIYLYFDNEYKGSVFLQNVPGDHSLNNHNNECQQHILIAWLQISAIYKRDVNTNTPSLLYKYPPIRKEYYLFSVFGPVRKIAKSDY
jgi:hypothetical protein